MPFVPKKFGLLALQTRLSKEHSMTDTFTNCRTKVIIQEYIDNIGLHECDSVCNYNNLVADRPTCKGCLYCIEDNLLDEECPLSCNENDLFDECPLNIIDGLR